MSRIEGVAPERAGLVGRIGYWLARRRLGAVPEPMTIYTHNPWINRAYGAFELFSERARHVDKKLKLLASVKSGTLVGCPW